jgi:molybdenum cofactor guanylyltransferase
MESGNQPARTGFVLAGGKSRRMGRDKAALPWEEGTLLDHMIHLIAPLVSRVRVVGRAPLPDGNPGRGPVEGIRTALEATTTDENLIVAVDLPFLSADLLGHMLTRLDLGAEPLVAVRVGGRSPLCLAARRTILPDVEAYLARGRRSIDGLLRAIGHDSVTDRDLKALGVPPDTFGNLNTMDDYRASVPR